jgi:phage terminase large subunit-like protein
MVATVLQNQWIPREPWPDEYMTSLDARGITGRGWGPYPRQEEFLARFDEQVFYGGAGGGGKSRALLMAAAQFVHEPSYSALILRRTYPELSARGALMDMAKDWWKNTAAHWSAEKHTWTFPSGATIQFGYLDNDSAHFQYAGPAYACICWDELTGHPSDYQYRWMFSRLRVPTGSRIPRRVRAAGNPGGPGNEWVKKRFRPHDHGPNFIPARIADNPSLDREGYELSLRFSDPVTREQIRDGNWDVGLGGRFKSKWFHRYGRHGDGFTALGRIVTAAETRERFLTCDPAATEKQIAEGTKKDDPDWTVIGAWAYVAGQLLLLACLRFRAEIADIARPFAQIYRACRAGKAYIEGAGIGRGPASIIKRDYPGLNVIEFPPPTKGKLLNAANAANMAEAGRIWLPADDSCWEYWDADKSATLEDILAELTMFSGDKKRDGHDDVVDMVAKAANVVEPLRAANEPGAVPRVHPVGGSHQQASEW